MTSLASARCNAMNSLITSAGLRSIWAMISDRERMTLVFSVTMIDWDFVRASTDVYGDGDTYWEMTP